MQIITKVGSGTILKNKIFCRYLFLQFFLQGLKPKQGRFIGTKTIFLTFRFHTQFHNLKGNIKKMTAKSMEDHFATVKMTSNSTMSYTLLPFPNDMQYIEHALFRMSKKININNFRFLPKKNSYYFGTKMHSISECGGQL